MKGTISEDTLNGLAQKLDEFGQVLTTDEQAMLLAIFRLGSNALDDVGQQAESESGLAGRAGLAGGALRTSTSMPLSQSIKTAFRPALARGLTGINVAANGVEVTGGIKWSA